MTAPTDTLARMEWPVKRRCRSCSRFFFAFSPLRTTCFPKCPGRSAANGKRAETDGRPLPREVKVGPCCGSGCSRCLKRGQAV
jgi:hypothetical protein